ncbi:MAG: ArnT family glycosyltransferase [Candidatus Eiseniibacteriota bacterium]
MRSRLRPAVVLLVLAALARVFAWQGLASGPASTAHRWDQSDMHFFHELATRIVEGDVLLNGTFHPIGHRWRLQVAREYLDRHPGESEALARAAAERGVFGPEVLLWERWLGEKRYYQEPLYTYLVAASIRLLGDDMRWVFAWQVLVGIGTVLLIHAAAARCFGEPAGFVAGLLAVGYAPLLFYEFVLLREALLAFAGIGLVVLLLRAARRDDLRSWLIAGLGCGAALLLKSVFAPIVLGALAYVGWTHRRRPGQAVRFAAALVLGVVCCLAPVVVRNAMVGADPFSLAGPGLANPFTSLAPAEVRVGSAVHEFADYGEAIEQSGGRLLPALAATIRSHGSAADFAEYLGRKFLHVWHWYEIPSNVNFHAYEAGAAVLRALPVRFVFAAPLALLGLVMAGRRLIAPAWPLTLAVVGSLATLVAFEHNSRLRIGLVPLLLPFAGFALVRTAHWIREGRWLSSGAALAGTALVALFVARPLPAGQERIGPVDCAVPLQTFYEPRSQDAAARGEWGEAARLLQEGMRVAPSWLRAPAAGRTLTGEERQLAALWVNVHERCAEYLRRAGRDGDAHRRLAGDLAAVYLGAPATGAPR